MEFEGRNQLRVACPFKKEACDTYRCAFWRWSENDFRITGRVYENAKTPGEKPLKVGQNWEYVPPKSNEGRGYWQAPDVNGEPIKKAMRCGYCGLAGRPYSLI